MLHRFREHFGTAGLVVAIVAMVAALAGGAYAASGGLSGKQKKEVEKISKKFAGKPGAPGATGPAGPAGAAGAAGKNGTNGTNGTDGTDGEDGKSVKIGTASVSECPSGGATVEVEEESLTKQPVCNGTTGFTETLPSEKTETGAWWLYGHGGEPAVAPISFPIPITTAAAAAIEIKYAGPSAQNPDPDCEGTPAEPTAPVGALCIYIAESSNNMVKPEVLATDYGNVEEIGTGGALLYHESASPGQFQGGSFAITAP